MEDVNTERRSPYVVLKLKTSATKGDIKSSFRKLAKQHHPDLNPHLPPKVAQHQMSQLTHAYDALMDEDGGGLLSKARDGRVALACEMFTLDELRIDRWHDVYSFRILYDDDDDNDISSNNNDGDLVDSSTTNTNTTSTTTQVNPIQITELNAHPDDSISDLKRQIQSSFRDEWGLIGRRLDRDRIATGWELIKVIEKSDYHPLETTFGGGKVIVPPPKHAGEECSSMEVMSYHLFLHSYDVRQGDIIHAVVRKHQEEDKDT